MIDSARGSTDEQVLTIIRPARGWVPLKLRELWTYRELFYFLVWRDIKVRYKQTVLGGAWAVIQPLFTMVVFSVVFGRLAGLSSDGIPYPIFTFAALVPWTFFASGLTMSSSSLVGSSNLVKKVYFPRLIIPLATVLAGLVDLAIALVILVAMMIVYGIAPTWNALWLPAFIVLGLLTSIGVGLWLSALNVKYRDIRYVVPFMTQLWMYATPVAYSSSLIPERWRSMLGLNPMAGVIEGFRWGLLGVDTHPGQIIVVSAAVTLVVLVSGAYFFRRTERSFADLV
jgi:lipopolysaccharide transport system permease protein